MSNQDQANITVPGKIEGIRRKKIIGNMASFTKSLTQHPVALIGLIIVLIYLFIAIFGPFIIPHSSTSGDLSNRLAPPVWMEGGTAKHILGTDEQGIDLLSRVIAGARISIVVGLVATLVSVVIGT